jgi:NAD(P)-dependent dehydrogenase (short-subunit alcohol dehydrogenase family)
MYGLQAVLPPLVAAGAGQVVVQTSATGEKPQPTLMAYSTMRAAANMMCRCAAMTVAPNGVCVNVIGTNFMNYPTEEAAHFALSLLDGYNMYTTGNAFPVAGGFNNEGMVPF